MAPALWYGATSRKIVQRMVVEGDLELETPASFGNGDTDDLTDMPLLVDPLDGRTPLLTGASIAGALRSFLREWENGYPQPDPQRSDSGSASRPARPPLHVLLFGGAKGDDRGEQSPLVVDDSLGSSPGLIELRAGVRIAPASRTAEEDKLFDMHLWAAGTRFPLRFELVVRERDLLNIQQLKQALAAALQGLSNGEIAVGARKRRGFGRALVRGWRTTTYDLTTTNGLLAWLAWGHDNLGTQQPIQERGADAAALLGVALPLDQRKKLSLEAEFALDGSLLIRTEGGGGPDMVHLQSARPDAQGSPVQRPVLSGTSLGGALRARAVRIANTLLGSTGDGVQTDRVGRLLDDLFGPDMEQVRRRREGGDTRAKPHASRLEIGETIIDGAETELVQARVSIDRFTGGSWPGALFTQQPAFGDDSTIVTVDLRLRNPHDYEVGLLLLLLKDIWTGDLPLGGESSVGRGRLKGRWAELSLSGRDRPWRIEARGEGIHVSEGEAEELQRCVDALRKHMKETP